MTKFAFNSVPTISAKRSSFPMNHTVSTSMPVGKLVPIDAIEVYPGDTWTMDCTAVARLTSSFIKPIYGNLNLDVYYFYVPSRLCFDKWGEIFGENNNGYYARTSVVNAPRIPNNDGSECYSNTVADYMGVAPGFGTDERKNVPLSAIPFRAFALIWNDWFRDENTQAPCNIQKGDGHSSETLNNDPWSVNNYTGQLPPVNKYHDYFTSCLKSPQKGEAVTPLGVVPIMTANEVHYMGDGDYTTNNAIRLGSYQTSYISYPNSEYNALPIFNFQEGDGSLTMGSTSSTISGNFEYNDAYKFDSSNLVADLSALTVNDLRNAFALQRMLELMNVGGTRYTEYLSTFFGVTSPDSRLQRPEYLGGNRIPLNVQQVATTSSDGLAELGAYSLSNGKGHFSKGFVEHGWLFTVACIRQEHLYSQGIARSLTRYRNTDFYNPVLAHLGEQPVYSYELYAPSDGVVATEDTPLDIFGYNEAWADLRYVPNKVTGSVRPELNQDPNGRYQLQSLAAYNIADYYGNQPTLSADFIKETSYLDNRISVATTIQDPFVLDFGFTGKAIRNIPVRSTPKLIG